jgi:hypothetical protein
MEKDGRSIEGLNISIKSSIRAGKKSYLNVYVVRQEKE